MTTFPYANGSEAVHDELFGLLVNTYYFQRRLNSLPGRAPALSPDDKIEEAVFLEAMQRDIVLGLCRLDEEGRDKWSFRDVNKEVGETLHDPSRDKVCGQAISDFRAAINTLKVKGRNNYIAHLSKKHDGTFPDTEDLMALVAQATAVYDTIAGSRQEYVLKGSGGNPTIDIRERLHV